MFKICGLEAQGCVYTIEYFQSHISFTPRQNFHLFSRS